MDREDKILIVCISAFLVLVAFALGFKIAYDHSQSIINKYNYEIIPEWDELCDRYWDKYEEYYEKYIDYKNKINSLNFTLQNERVQEFLKVMETIEKVRQSQIYERTVYDCSNFTEDGINELERLGFEAYYTHANVINETIGHAWIKVCFDFDIVSGTEKPRYERYYNITKKE